MVDNLASKTQCKDKGRYQRHERASEVIEMTEETSVNVRSVMRVLDKCYDQVLVGMPKVSKPVEQLANEYLEKYVDKEKASKALVNNSTFPLTGS